MQQNFKNRVVIITGSSMGIGNEMAWQIAKKGGRVVLTGRNPDRLEKAGKELEADGHKVLTVAGDVSKVADCKKLVEETIREFGQIDVLINNAGVSTEGTVEELDGSVIKKIMEVNYLGSVYPTQSALPYLKNSQGSVIFISSVAGIRGIPNYSVYSSSKMALTALAEALRIELANDKIHVGIAYVGFTENDPQKTIYDAKGLIVPQPKRDFIKAEPVEKVAGRIIGIIENKKFKEVFTPLGKLNSVLNKLTPGLVHRVLKRNFYKQQ